MNELIVLFDWKKEASLVKGENRFLLGHLDLAIQRSNYFLLDNRSYFYNPESKVVCCLLGYISNLSQIIRKYALSNSSDVGVVEQLFSSRQLQSVQELDGIFLIFIFDEKNNKGYIFQSKYGFNLPVYYFQEGDKLIISTSLKKLLPYIRKRELNVSAVQDFFYYEWMIPNEKTLVQGVNKLISGRCMIIDGEKKRFSIRNLKYVAGLISIPEAKDNLLPSINQSISGLYDKLEIKKATQTFTSGWDSNLMLYYLKKLDVNVNAITLNGGAIDEVPATKKILKHYSNVNHITGNVSSSLSILPDIVWRYEGYIFQEGIFLRYELAKLLEKCGVGAVFLGAAADPILYQDHREINKPIFNGSKNKLDIRIDYHLKMHEIMLNSFGVQGIYPFVNNKVAINSKSLGELNKDKAFYKEEIRKVLGSEISNLLIKSGDLVDIEKVATESEDLLDFLLESDFLRKILTKNQIDEIKLKKDYLVMIQLAYIYLFNELFISGKYDNNFGEGSFDLSFDYFVNSEIKSYVDSINNVIGGKNPSIFRVDIHPIGGCNSHCIMCDNWKNNFEEKISFERMIGLFDELKEFGVNEVRFHGQEPTLRKDLSKLIFEAKARGFKVGLKTNALILDEAKVKECVDSGLDEVYLSIDSAFEEVHNKLRGNTVSFKQNILAAKQFKKLGLKVFSNGVITKFNYDKLDLLMDLANDLNLDRVSFVNLNCKNKEEIGDLKLNLGEFKEFYFEIYPRILEKSKKYDIPVYIDPYFVDLLGLSVDEQIEQLRNHPDRFELEINNFVNLDYGKEFYSKNRCFGVFDHITINYDGLVYPCCVVPREKGYAQGSILDRSFTEIWKSEGYIQYREKILKGKCSFKDQCTRNLCNTQRINRIIK